MIEPRYLPLIGYADGWSAATAGEIVAAPVFVGGKSPEEIDRDADAVEGRDRHDAADDDQLRAPRSAGSERRELRAEFRRLCDERRPRSARRRRGPGQDAAAPAGRTRRVPPGHTSRSCATPAPA